MGNANKMQGEVQRTISLVLKRKWFDMIASGEKTEEYRSITQYFLSRLCDIDPHSAGILLYYYKSGGVDFDMSKRNPVKLVQFFDGYSKERRRMVVVVECITVGTGRKIWGATDHSFIIKLGRIIYKSW